MPYAQGRLFNDADSHIMETKDWLFGYADPKIRTRLAPMDLVPAGGRATEELVEKLPGIIERRRKDPAFVRRYGLDPAAGHGEEDKELVSKRKTQSRFGYEWTRFDDYACDNFPDFVAPLPEHFFSGKLGLDVGCGAGRQTIVGHVRHRLFLRGSASRSS